MVDLAARTGGTRLCMQDRFQPSNSQSSMPQICEKNLAAEKPSHTDNEDNEEVRISRMGVPWMSKELLVVDNHG